MVARPKGPPGVVGPPPLISLWLLQQASQREMERRREAQRASDKRGLSSGVSGPASMEALIAAISRPAALPPAAPAPEAPLPKQPQPSPPQQASSRSSGTAAPRRSGAPDLVYLRRPPIANEELFDNWGARQQLAKLFHNAQTGARAGKPVGESMIVVQGAPGVGKTHCINLELRRRKYHVVCNSSLDVYGGGKGEAAAVDHGGGGGGGHRKNLFEFLREQASSHTADKKPLAIILEEADELFAACPKALNVICGALVVATMDPACLAAEPAGFQMFKKIRDQAKAGGRLVRFDRPNRDNSRKALLRLRPHMPEAVQDAILDEASGDFRQLALVEEHFRHRQALQAGSLTQDLFQTPFQQAKGVLRRGQLPRHLDDADYTTDLVLANFHTCCGQDLASLEAMAIVAAEACEADVRVSAAYRGNNNSAVSETARLANEVVMRRAAAARGTTNVHFGELAKPPTGATLQLARRSGFTYTDVASVAALEGVAEAETGQLPSRLFRNAAKKKAPCVWLLNSDVGGALHETSWLGGVLYRGRGGEGGHDETWHHFPPPGSIYARVHPLGTGDEASLTTLRYDLDLAALSATIGVSLLPDPAIAL